MNKEEWRQTYIKKIKGTDWSKKRFSVQKIQFDGSVNTLQRLAPGILSIIKKAL